jgi:hypothetical protein
MDACTWSVDGGPALPLLAAIDAALGPADREEPWAFPDAYRAALGVGRGSPACRGE